MWLLLDDHSRLSVLGSGLLLTSLDASRVDLDDALGDLLAGVEVSGKLSALFGGLLLALEGTVVLGAPLLLVLGEDGLAGSEVSVAYSSLARLFEVAVNSPLGAVEILGAWRLAGGALSEFVDASLCLVARVLGARETVVTRLALAHALDSEVLVDLALDSLASVSRLALFLAKLWDVDLLALRRRVLGKGATLSGAHSDLALVLWLAPGVDLLVLALSGGRVAGVLGACNLVVAVLGGVGASLDRVALGGEALVALLGAALLDVQASLLGVTDIVGTSVLVVAELLLVDALGELLGALLNVELHAWEVSVAVVVALSLAVSGEPLSGALSHLLGEALSFGVSSAKAHALVHAHWWLDVPSAHTSSDTSAAVDTAASRGLGSLALGANDGGSSTARNVVLLVDAISAAALNVALGLELLSTCGLRGCRSALGHCLLVALVLEDDSASGLSALFELDRAALGGLLLDTRVLIAGIYTACDCLSCALLVRVLARVVVALAHSFDGRAEFSLVDGASSFALLVCVVSASHELSGEPSSALFHSNLSAVFAVLSLLGGLASALCLGDSAHAVLALEGTSLVLLAGGSDDGSAVASRLASCVALGSVGAAASLGGRSSLESASSDSAGSAQASLYSALASPHVLGSTCFSHLGRLASALGDDSLGAISSLLLLGDADLLALSGLGKSGALSLASSHLASSASHGLAMESHSAGGDALGVAVATAAHEPTSAHELLALSASSLGASSLDDARSGWASSDTSALAASLESGHLALSDLTESLSASAHTLGVALSFLCALLDLALGASAARDASDLAEYVLSSLGALAHCRLALWTSSLLDGLAHLAGCASSSALPDEPLDAGLSLGRVLVDASLGSSRVAVALGREAVLSHLDSDLGLGLSTDGSASLGSSVAELDSSGSNGASSSDTVDSATSLGTLAHLGLSLLAPSTTHTHVSAAVACLPACLDDSLTASDVLWLGSALCGGLCRASARLLVADHPLLLLWSAADLLAGDPAHTSSVLVGALSRLGVSEGALGVGDDSWQPHSSSASLSAGPHHSSPALSHPAGLSCSAPFDGASLASASSELSCSLVDDALLGDDLGNSLTNSLADVDAAASSPLSERSSDSAVSDAVDHSLCSLALAGARSRAPSSSSPPPSSPPDTTSALSTTSPSVPSSAAGSTIVRHSSASPSCDSAASASAALAGSPRGPGVCGDNADGNDDRNDQY